MNYFEDITLDLDSDKKFFYESMKSKLFRGKCNLKDLGNFFKLEQKHDFFVEFYGDFYYYPPESSIHNYLPDSGEYQTNLGEIPEPSIISDIYKKEFLFLYVNGGLENSVIEFGLKFSDSKENLNLGFLVNGPVFKLSEESLFDSIENKNLFLPELFDFNHITIPEHYTLLDKSESRKFN